MKKLIGLILIGLLTISLGACSKTNNSSNNGKNSASSVANKNETQQTVSDFSKENYNTSNPSCTFKSQTSKKSSTPSGK